MKDVVAVVKAVVVKADAAVIIMARVKAVAADIIMAKAKVAVADTAINIYYIIYDEQ